MKPKKDKTQAITGKKNGAAQHKYAAAPNWEKKIPAQSGGKTAAAAATPAYPAPDKKKEATAPVKTVTETAALPIYRQDTYIPALVYAAGMQEKNTAEKPVVRKLEKRLPAVQSPLYNAMGRVEPVLPTPTGRDEKEELRAESRLRTQLAKGVSPEELGAREELREQRLQNLPADELRKRQEQAVGHLNEAREAIGDRERQEREKRAAYDMINTSMAAGGLPYDGGETGGETDKALQKELAKWQGIVNDLSGRYYYRENEEQAAKLAGDREGQSRVQTVEDILEDLRVLGEVATGQYGDRRDREVLMAKYGLDQRELEVQAPTLIQQLQGELEKVKETVKDAGYDYDRMTEYQKRMEQIQRAIEGQKHTEEFAEKHPVLSSAASILTSPVQGVDYFTQLAKGYGHSDPEKLESYVPANVYEMRATNFVRNVRGTVARGLEEKYGWSIGDQNVASFLYQTGMSMGDFLFNALLTGNFSGGLGGVGTEAAKKAAGNLSLAIMGSGAAANTTAEAIERGLSNRQAYTLGAIAGVAEILTEKVSLETLLDRTALNKSAMGYLLKNIAAEGSEEVASDLINWAADVLVAKDKSQWQQAIDGYMAQGMGEKEAFEAALKDQLISMAWSGVGGGLSGGVMAGGSVAINGYLDRGAATSAETMQTRKTAPGERAVKLTPYSQDEAKNFLTGARNKVLGFGSDILEFARRAISTKGGNERLYCGKLPQETADMIFESTGRDLSDFNFVISSDGVWHAYEHHGQDTEKTKGQQVSVRVEDMALLPGVIAKPDRVFESPRKDGHGRTALIFEKAMGDTVVTITGISAGRKVLDFDSMRIMKERSPAASRADSTIDPSLTSKTSSGQTSLTDTIIPLMGDGVKKEFTQEGEGYTGSRAKARGWSTDSIVEAILTSPAAVETLAREARIPVTEGMDEAQRRAVVKRVVESLLEEEKNAAAESGGTRLQIKETADGKKYVKADRQVIFGNDPDSWGEQVEEYINGKIRKGEDVTLLTEDGDELKLTEKTAGKASFAYRPDGSRMSDDEYYLKVNAEAHIDELAQISERGKKTVEDKDGRHGPFAKDGWNYRTAYFQDFDGKYYQLRISVAQGEDGKVIYNIGDIKERSYLTVDGSSAKGGALNDGVTPSSKEVFQPLTALPPEGGAQSDQKTPFKDSISQRGEKSNSKLLPEGTEALEVEEDAYQDPLVRELWRVFGKDRPAEEEDRPYRSDDPIIQAIVDLDRSTRFARREGTDSGLVFDEYVRTTLPCGMAERINTLAKIFGVRVRFADEVENGQANASISGREILVEKNNKNPVLFLLGHEWTHRVQDLAPREYRAFREAIGEELYSRAEEVLALYERQGRSISYEQALDEAAADYAGRMLEDCRVLDEFIERHRGDRTVLERFTEVIRELIGALTGKEKTQAQKAERKLRAAMEAAAKQTERSGTAATESGGVRLSLKEFVDGRRFVDVDTDQGRFDGLSEKGMGYEARRVIKEKFLGKVIGLNNKVFVNGNTAEEYGRPQRRLAKAEYTAKMRAATELDNLLDAGTNFRTEPDGRDGHIHSKAVGDFRYFDTIFKVGGEYYSGIVNIMPVAKGLLLKDITQIRNITQDIRASYGDNPLGRFLRDASMDSISQGEGKSNRKMLPEDTGEPEGKEDTYQDPLVREIWRVFGKDRSEE